LFDDEVNCDAYKNKDTCDQNKAACVWDFGDKNCKHTYGWESWQKGLFSGAMIIGAMVGSFIAGRLLEKFGRKKVLGGIGCVTLAGGLLMTLARAVDSYALMIVARIIVGVGIGATCVAAPLYVGEMAPANSKGTYGVLFQLGVTGGIVLEAFLAFVLAPGQTGPQHWELRIHLGLILPCLFFSALCILVASAIRESETWLRNRQTDDSEAEAFIRDGEADNWGDDVRMPLVVAVVLSFATQMTGINAIMNYAPSITKSVGLQPLTGNLLVMLWNFVTSAASIPIASKFDRRTMYLGGITCCTVACFLTGIPTFPDVVSDDAKKVLASIGIVIFILSFEIGMGPMFFILATELFPPSFRNTGSSFTNTVQLIFNTIINFGFPVAVEALSGGAAGNQDKGMAIVFVIFGCIGVVGTLFLFRFLRPYKV